MIINNNKIESHRTPIGERLYRNVRHIHAAVQDDAGQLRAVLAQRLHGQIGDLLALGQVQVLNVVAVLGERTDGSVAHRLAAVQRERLQEAAAAVRNVLDDRPLDVALELKQVDLLPVAAVQREDVPVLVHLGAPAQ